MWAFRGLWWSFLIVYGALKTGDIKMIFLTLPIGHGWISGTLSSGFMVINSRLEGIKRMVKIIVSGINKINELKVLPTSVTSGALMHMLILL